MYLTPQNTPCAVIFAIGSKIVLYCVVITRLEVQEEGKERGVKQQEAQSPWG